MAQYSYVPCAPVVTEQILIDRAHVDPTWGCKPSCGTSSLPPPMIPTSRIISKYYGLFAALIEISGNIYSVWLFNTYPDIYNSTLIDYQTL